MNEAELVRIDRHVKQWLHASREFILNQMQATLNVSQKKRVGAIW